MFIYDCFVGVAVVNVIVMHGVSGSIARSGQNVLFGFY